VVHHAGGLIPLALMLVSNQERAADLRTVTLVTLYFGYIKVRFTHEPFVALGNSFGWKPRAAAAFLIAKRISNLVSRLESSRSSLLKGRTKRGVDG